MCFKIEVYELLGVLQMKTTLVFFIHLCQQETNSKCLFGNHVIIHRKKLGNLKGSIYILMIQTYPFTLDVALYVDMMETSNIYL